MTQQTLFVIHPGTGTILAAHECVVVGTVLPDRLQEAVENGSFNPAVGKRVLNPWRIDAGDDVVSIVVRPGDGRPVFAVEVVPQDEGVCVDVYEADADGYCEGQPLDS